MTKTKMLCLLNDFIRDDNYLKLNELKTALEADIRDENNRANGKANIARAFKSIGKTSSKLPNTNMQLPWKHYDFKVACDGYRLLMTVEPVELETSNHDNSTFTMSMLDGYQEQDLCVLVTPELGHVKTVIAKNKAEKKLNHFEFRHVDGIVTVDATYLLDMLTADPHATIQTSATSVIGPVYFNKPGDITFGILMPIRANK